ncbi:unnamed protein product [Soboliphyme baturini]|uniref:PLAT domain-containing protein n=1 Tax=Soboliphyme baturini TaxID=241478 RepID=A0A183JAW4_9BILA|nr:unnamed protein product [Soboliphyme baturini]
MLTDYLIYVKTSDRFGAGTDADVFIQLVGDDGISDEWQLRKSQHLNKFERNQIDQFTFYQQHCVGNIRKIIIRHSNTGEVAF